MMLHIGERYVGLHRNDRIRKTVNVYSGTRFISRSDTMVKKYPEIRPLAALYWLAETCYGASEIVWATTVLLLLVFRMSFHSLVYKPG